MNFQVSLGGPQVLAEHSGLPNTWQTRNVFQAQCARLPCTMLGGSSPSSLCLPAKQRGGRRGGWGVSSTPGTAREGAVSTELVLPAFGSSEQCVCREQCVLRGARVSPQALQVQPGFPPALLCSVSSQRRAFCHCQGLEDYLLKHGWARKGLHG